MNLLVAIIHVMEPQLFCNTSGAHGGADPGTTDFI